MSPQESRGVPASWLGDLGTALPVLSWGVGEEEEIILDLLLSMVVPSGPLGCGLE